ncbi:MAG: SMP-30/gluconolactonase/LRE family protein [Candidatus Brocadiia bacterium]|nr:SMP-30/gluconolactonase/LRE family protein [Candidatus Brocadiia bacterium]
MEPELIADYQCDTGEGPMWHQQEKRLYWTDIPAGRMFRYNPTPGEHEPFYDGDVVAASPSRPTARSCCSWSGGP